MAHVLLRSHSVTYANIQDVIAAVGRGELVLVVDDTLADPRIGAADFARPGHVFPLRAADRGVLARPGHTEATTDLARLAGLRPYGVLCEVVDDDGSMARRPSRHRFAQRHGLLMTTIADLVGHRRRTEPWVTPLSEASLPTRHGVFHARVYGSEFEDCEHVALTLGQVALADDVPVRVHSECMTSEVFGSLRCDCRDQLDAALAEIAHTGHRPAPSRPCCETADQSARLYVTRSRTTRARTSSTRSTRSRSSSRVASARSATGAPRR